CSSRGHCREPMERFCLFARASRQRSGRRRKSRSRKLSLFILSLPCRTNDGRTDGKGPEMIEIPIYNQAGQEIEKYSVDEAKLGGQVRAHLLKQAVVMYHANQRQGTVRTQARGEVEGSTRKIYRQKGTGNARMGPVRNPVR